MIQYSNKVVLILLCGFLVCIPDKKFWKTQITFIINKLSCILIHLTKQSKLIHLWFIESWNFKSIIIVRRSPVIKICSFSIRIDIGEDILIINTKQIAGNILRLICTNSIINFITFSITP